MYQCDAGKSWKRGWARLHLQKELINFDDGWRKQCKKKRSLRMIWTREQNGGRFYVSIKILCSLKDIGDGWWTFKRSNVAFIDDSRTWCNDFVSFGFCITAHAIFFPNQSLVFSISSPPSPRKSCSLFAVSLNHFFFYRSSRCKNNYALSYRTWVYTSTINDKRRKKKIFSFLSHGIRDVESKHRLFNSPRHIIYDDGFKDAQQKET